MKNTGPISAPSLPSFERPRARAAAAVLAIAFLAGAIGCARRSASGGDDTIRLSGNIEVVDAQLSFKVPGRLVERTVDEGARVQAGQLIARLDDTELVQELAAREAELAVARAALADLEAGARPQEIASAEAALRSAEAERDRASLEFRRQQDLRASDVSTERELEVAQATFRVTESRALDAAEKLALVREGPRAQTIAQARARVEQARAALALAQTRVANARLESPLGGVVLEKHAEPGEFLSTGSPVVTVADTSQVWLRAYLDQTDLGRVRLGQPVEVRTDAYPAKKYTGTLAFISSEAEFTPKTVQTEKERVTLVFRVKIVLANDSGELKPGMAADAFVAAAAASDAR